MSKVLTDQPEKRKAGIRVKVQQPFRLAKCQFAHRETRYR
jgi:hypothetical protein